MRRPGCYAVGVAHALRALLLAEAGARAALLVLEAGPAGAFGLGVHGATVTEWLPIYALSAAAWSLDRRDPVGFGLGVLAHGLVAWAAVPALFLALADAAWSDVSALTWLGLAAGPIHLAWLVALVRPRGRLAHLVGVEPDLATVHERRRVPLRELRLGRALTADAARGLLGRLSAAGRFAGAIDDGGTVRSAADLAGDPCARRCPQCAAAFEGQHPVRCPRCERELARERAAPLSSPSPPLVEVIGVATAAVGLHFALGGLVTLLLLPPRAGAPALAVPPLVIPGLMAIGGMLTVYLGLSLRRRRPRSRRPWLAIAALSVAVDLWLAWTRWSTLAGVGDLDAETGLSVSLALGQLGWIALRLAAIRHVARPGVAAWFDRGTARAVLRELEHRGGVTFDGLAMRLGIPDHQAAALAHFMTREGLDEAVIQWERGRLLELDRLPPDDDRRWCTECGARTSVMDFGAYCGWCGHGHGTGRATYRTGTRAA